MKGLDYINIATNIAFDDDLEHVSCNAFRTFVEMICMAGYYLNDGIVPLERVLKLCNADDIGNALQELKDGGYIRYDAEGNIILQNYAKWNKTREEVERLRGQYRDRVTRYRASEMKNVTRFVCDDVTRSVTPLSKSKSINITPPTPPGETTPKKKEDYSEDFETWWKLYPKKTDKGHARKAYAAARRKASAEEIKSGLERNLAELTSREVQYIPMGSTWLNGERWLDEGGTTTETPEAKYNRLRGMGVSEEQARGAAYGN